MFVKISAKVDSEPNFAGTGVTRQVLISPEEGPHFAMRQFTIQPGGGMPNHTNQVEHEQYVVSGSARIGIKDQVFQVEAGDVIFIPADAPHWYDNTGDEPFVFLCLVPNLPDKTKILGDIPK